MLIKKNNIISMSSRKSVKTQHRHMNSTSGLVSSVKPLESFFGNPMYCDLKIITSDQKKLYVSKWWLCAISNYFKELLEDQQMNNIIAQTENERVIDMHKSEYNFIVIEVLFECLLRRKHDDEIKTQFLSKLNDKDSINEFLDICIKYKIQPHMISLCDDYFSELDIEPMLSTSFVIMINILNMKQTNYAIISKLSKKCLCPDMINELLNLNTMSCQDLNFCIPDRDCSNLYLYIDVFIVILDMWIESKNPTNEDLQNSKLYNFDYTLIPDNKIDDFIRCLDKVDKAKNYQSKVRGELLKKSHMENKRQKIY